ncbi:MAG: hypothetical protein U0326_01770 [Polyangiales bacterium]
MTDVSDELYRSTVCRMIESHGARVFHCAVTVSAGLRYAPTSAWLRFCGGQVRELTALFASLSAIYEAVNDGVGLAPPSRSIEHPKLPAAPASWPEAVAAQLVAGRQCRWQLHEHQQCSYAPYRELVARAVSELDARQSLIEGAAADVAHASDTAEPFRDALDRWMTWAIEAFGRPNTPGMAYAIREGLRRRDASATLHDFLEDLRAVSRTRDLGLGARFMPEPERPSLVAVLSELARSDKHR